MSAAARVEAWLDRRSDGLSPLVVKEARQAVRGREFLVSFTVSLVAGLVVAFMGATRALAGTNTAGRWTFGALMGCLAVLGLAVVPLGAFGRFRQERQEQTLELISLTALSARRIVVGKLLAQSVMLLTLFAAIAPFLTMSFLLGGIDFTTILVGLLLLYMGSVWAGALCLFLATLFRSRAASGIVFGVVGLVFVLLLFLGVTLFQAVSRGVLFPSVFAFGTSSAARLKEFSILTTFWMTTLVNLVLLAENRLSLATEDTVTPLRIGFLVQFVLLAGWGIATWFTTGRPGTARSLVTLCSLHLGVVAAFVLTEGLSVPRRVRQRMREASAGTRLLSLFGPGAGRGASYVLMQMALFALCMATFAPPDLEWRRLLAACGYICFFTGVPVIAFTRLAPSAVTVLKLRVAVLCTVAASMVLPDLLHYVIVRPDTLSLAYTARHLVNPFTTFTEWSVVEAQGWAIVPALIGLTGVLAYIEVIRLGSAATSPAVPGGPEVAAVEGESGRGGLIY